MPIAPWVVPLLSKVGSFVASSAPAAITAYAQHKGAQAQNAANATSAREQMEFQRDMSNTAHQREMADLKAAGINPMMAAKFGGASTPGGASFSSENEVGDAVNSAMAVQRQRAELQGMKLNNAKVLSDIDVNRQTTANSAMDSRLKEATIDNMRNRLALDAANSSFSNENMHSRMLKEYAARSSDRDLIRQRLEADIASRDSNFQLDKSKAILGGINSASSMIGDIASSHRDARLDRERSKRHDQDRARHDRERARREKERKQKHFVRDKSAPLSRAQRNALYGKRAHSVARAASVASSFLRGY